MKTNDDKVEQSTKTVPHEMKILVDDSSKDKTSQITKKTTRKINKNKSKAISFFCGNCHMYGKRKQRENSFD